VNKRGFSNQIMTVLIMGVLLAFIMIMIFALSIGVPIISKMFNQANSLIQSNIANQSDANLTTATQVSIGNANSSVQMFEWITYVLLFGLIVTFFIMCFFVRTYPFLAFFIAFFKEV